MIHSAGDEPDYWHSKGELFRCEKCKSWSSDVAISTTLNEHYCTECINDERGLEKYFENASSDFDVGEIEDIIIELKHNYKNNIK